MGKLPASATATMAGAGIVQPPGGSGSTEGDPVEWCFRDAKSTQRQEGTPQGRGSPPSAGTGLSGDRRIPVNIIVCIKQVPDTETRIRVKDGGRGVVRDNVKFIMNPFDEFALEEAVRIKEKQGGSVIAMSLGPDRAKDVLRTSLAIGADKAVHVSDAGLAGTDSLGVAKALAAAIRKFDHDLILLGKKAVGSDRGQVGAQVAQLLGVPFISHVVKIEWSDDARTATVHREVEGGREVLEVGLPAVLTTEKGLNELRHAPLKGIMMAKSKPIQALSTADLGLGADAVASHLRVVGMDYPPQRAAGKVVKGEPAEAVRELVRLLREEAKVV